MTAELFDSQTERAAAATPILSVSRSGLTFPYRHIAIIFTAWSMVKVLGC